MTTEYELVKVVGVPVVAVREDGRVVQEVEGVPRPCYGADQLVALWDDAAAEVERQNEGVSNAPAETT